MIKLKLSNNSPRILISSGGTGGHIYTGIAIANEIKKIIPNSNIYFIGSNSRMEIHKIPEFGYTIKTIPISGGRNKIFSIYCLKLLIELINSFILVNKIIKDFSPEIIIGTGGFVTFPVLCAAKTNKIPILIQEQNILPGLTNRIFSSYAKKICLAYKQAKYFFPKKKVVITGNPVRSEVYNNKIDKEIACLSLGLDKNKPIVLSLGGSQGSQIINKVWINEFQKLIKLDIQLIWQIGKFDYEKIKSNKIFYHSNIILTDFIKDITTCYSAADIIVSRAGAITISEICLIGKPYISIPFSKSSDNHQNQNAEFLKKKQAALVLHDEELEEKLVDSVVELLNNINLKNKMTKNIIKLGKPNASFDIVQEILRIIV